MRRLVVLAVLLVGAVFAPRIARAEVAQIEITVVTPDGAPLQASVELKRFDGDRYIGGKWLGSTSPSTGFWGGRATLANPYPHSIRVASENAAYPCDAETQRFIPGEQRPIRLTIICRAL
jgi:hypothetical protein